MAFDLAAAKERLTRSFPLVDDHPDVAGVLRDPELLALLGPALAEPFRDVGVTVVVAPEARGPIVGALTAMELGVGLVLARKADRNHPGADIQVRSETTWRGQREDFQARSFDLGRRDRVLIVDDWITTGNSIRAARNYLRVLGAEHVGTAVLVNKAELATRRELMVHSLVDFEQISRSP